VQQRLRLLSVFSLNLNSALARQRFLAIGVIAFILHPFLSSASVKRQRRVKSSQSSETRLRYDGYRTKNYYAS